MTKDEAIEKVQADDNDRFSRDRWLTESLVKLGRLKLDERKKPRDRLLDEIAVMFSGTLAGHVRGWLDDNGYKIVEK